MKIKTVILISSIVSIAIITIKAWIDDYKETQKIIEHGEELHKITQELEDQYIVDLNTYLQTDSDWKNVFNQFKDVFR